MGKRSLRIIVIGRDEDINQILKLMLIRRGFKAKYAITGINALEAIKNDKPDIIIFDIEKWSMEEMMINERIKTEEGLKDISVIFCVSRYVRAIIPYKNGKDAYLRKPFEFEELYKKIRLII